MRRERGGRRRCDAEAGYHWSWRSLVGAGGSRRGRLRLPPVAGLRRRRRCRLPRRSAARRGAGAVARRSRRRRGGRAGRADAVWLRPGADREAADAALLIVSRTGRIAYANPAAHEALPRLQPDAHYANVLRAPAFVEAVAATLADGEERRVRFTADPGPRALLRGAGRRCCRRAAPSGPRRWRSCRSRTGPRRGAPRQLRSDFVANASHELRTPLAAIIGYIETLQHHARDDAEARERFLAIMAREAGRMQRLVDDLMSLSRIEMTEHLRPVEELVARPRSPPRAPTALLPVARQQGVDARDRPAPSGARVLGDRDQLAQVFANLIDNAMRYGGAGSDGAGARRRPEQGAPEPARHRRRGRRPGHPARASAPADRALLPGQRRARAATRAAPGSGSRSSSTSSTGTEGRLEIASTPGKGSVFTVWLPLRGGRRRARRRRAGCAGRADRRSA